jgi:hypothetical protein
VTPGPEGKFRLSPEEVRLLGEVGVRAHDNGSRHAVKPWYAGPWTYTYGGAEKVLRLALERPELLLALDARARLGDERGAREAYGCALSELARPQTGV